MFEKQTIAIIGAAAIAAAGFGAGIFYENSVPWGLRAQRDRVADSIPAKVTKAFNDGALAQKNLDMVALTTWQQRLTDCQNARRSDSETAAQNQDAARGRVVQSRDAAYQLGRQAGLARCPRGENTNAENSGSVGDAVPADATGMRDDVDLASTLAGAAYRPRPR